MKTQIFFPRLMTRSEQVSRKINKSIQQQLIQQPRGKATMMTDEEFYREVDQVKELVDCLHKQVIQSSTDYIPTLYARMKSILDEIQFRHLETNYRSKNS